MKKREPPDEEHKKGLTLLEVIGLVFKFLINVEIVLKIVEEIRNL